MFSILMLLAVTCLATQAGRFCKGLSGRQAESEVSKPTSIMHRHQVCCAWLCGYCLNSTTVCT